MPGIFTHYAFALDAEASIPCLKSLTPDERDAFRLGSQGPDPLLFSSAAIVNPRFYLLGSRMHGKEPSALLAAFARSWRGLASEERGIAQAYLQGFLCHYLLDRSVHPLVYAQQYAYCDAGVSGLDRTCGHEVHAAIEMELDELMIRRTFGSPGEGLDLACQCLPGSDKVLEIISKLYVLSSASAFGLVIPRRHYATSVKAYRRAEWLVDSLKRRGAIPQNAPKGPKHIIPWLRELGHTGAGVESSIFTNSEGWNWPHPHGEQDPVSSSFEELYDSALRQAGEWLPGFCHEVNTPADARMITQGRNFSGKLVEACL